jgi:hypothetical protein
MPAMGGGVLQRWRQTFHAGGGGIHLALWRHDAKIRWSNENLASVQIRLDVPESPLLNTQ